MNDDLKELRRLAIHAITVRSEDVGYGEVLRKERAYQEAVSDPWVVIRLIDEAELLKNKAEVFERSFNSAGPELLRVEWERDQLREALKQIAQMTRFGQTTVYRIACRALGTEE